MVRDADGAESVDPQDEPDDRDPENGKYAEIQDAEIKDAEIDDEPGGVKPSETPDVLLDVPVLHVDEVELEVENLRARVSLQAEVLDLLKLNVGADVALGRVELDIKGVDAQALLKVRLDNVVEIIGRVLTSIDRNPQILEHVTASLGETVREVGSGTGRAVGELGRGAGQAVEDVGSGAGQAVENVGEGAGSAVEDVGSGAGQAAEGVADAAGGAVGDVGEAADYVESSAGRVTGGIGGTAKEKSRGADQTAEAGEEPPAVHRTREGEARRPRKPVHKGDSDDRTRTAHKERAAHDEKPAHRRRSGERSASPDRTSTDRRRTAKRKATRRSASKTG